VLLFVVIVFLANAQEFLRTEFSEENLVFWTKCEKYKRLSDVNEVSTYCLYHLLLVNVFINIISDLI